MRGKLKFTCWVLLILLGAQIAVILSSKQEEENTITTEYIKKFDEAEIAKCIGKKIKESDQIIDSRNDTLLLSDLSNSDSLFVIRFSSFSCESCKEFAQTTAFAYDIPLKYKVIVLVANIPVGDLHVLNRMNKNVLFYKADCLGSDFDEGLTPYTMIVFNSTIQSFFIPHKEIPENYQVYLKSLI